jgi:hypothetical protein
MQGEIGPITVAILLLITFLPFVIILMDDKNLPRK